jgi:hypothetical protein
MIKPASKLILVAFAMSTFQAEAVSVKVQDEISSKYACPYSKDDPSFRLVDALMTEQFNIGKASYFVQATQDKIMQLVDRYAAPSYLKQYHASKTSEFEMYGSVRENVVCVKPDRTVITVIANPRMGWINVLSYKVVSEGGHNFILPPGPPTPKTNKQAKMTPLNYASFWVNPSTTLEHAD